jgi:hypothetical protein
MPEQLVRINRPVDLYARREAPERIRFYADTFDTELFAFHHIWQSSFDPIGKENHHRTAAKELLWIREQFLILIERCHLGLEEVDHLQMILETMTRELTAVYKFAPDTLPEAYAQASAALKGGEFTFSDDEIDAFLPQRLRKVQREAR